MRGRTATGRGRADAALRLLATLVVGMGVTACDLDEVLSVDLPGKVVAGDLDNPALAELLVRSSVSSFECAWSMYTAGTAHHSDEYMNASGNVWFRNMGWRQLEANDERLSSGECTTAYSMYAPLHMARFQTNDVYNRLSSEEFADVPNRTRHLATLRAYGGYALVGLGEGFCEMTIPEEEGVPGPLFTPEQVLRKAEERFSEAIALAEESGNQDMRNMALVGRARVRLDLKDYAGVIADASQVPAGYVKMASRGEEEARRYNHNYNTNNSRIQNAHATIAPNFRNLRIDAQGRPFEGPVDDKGAPAGGEGVPDPRVTVVNFGLFGHNAVTPLWHHEKYTSRSSPLPIASYKEARLFLAEAYAQTGEVERAREIINARRVELDLPTFDLPATQEEMMDLIIEERRRELFVEGGHRMNDMLRFEGTSHDIPWLGEPGSIHPNGLDSVGGSYGEATCFPLPTVERIGNPNIPDS